MKAYIHRSSFSIRGARAAFTLLEILVVLAVLSLLSALLFPAFSRARELAKRTTCTSNLKQVGLAMQLYESDYDELSPRLSTLYSTYTTDARLLICPSDPQRGLIPGNDRLEGDLYLPTGVSYEYLPNWAKAQELEWYRAAPHFGRGKWDSLTPLAGCMWHWAKWSTPTLAATLLQRGAGNSISRVVAACARCA